MLQRRRTRSLTASSEAALRREDLRGRYLREVVALRKTSHDAAEAARAAFLAALPELDRAWLARSSWTLDFLEFSTKLDIIDKSGTRGKLRANAIQSAFEVSRSGRDIALKPRQVGFTTWELARDVWFFLTRRGARVVVVVQSSQDHDALNETSEKLRIMFEGLAAEGVDLDFDRQSITNGYRLGDATLRIVEAGASEAAAGKKGRGGTIHRLHVTELAFFEYAQKTLNALLECVPSASTGSEIVIESTANGASGDFFERYQQAKRSENGYTPHFFRWLDQLEYSTPLLPGETFTPESEREKTAAAMGATSAQLKWYRAKVRDKKQDLVDQEYPLDEDTCWLVAGRLFFDRASLISLRATTRDPLRLEWGGTLRIYAEPDYSKRYVIAADPSEGTGGDACAGIVYDSATGEHVASLHGQFPPWLFAEKLAHLGAMYVGAEIVVERNNHGHAVILALTQPPRDLTGDEKRERQPYLYVYKDKDGKYGWVSNEVSRVSALDALEGAIRSGEWTTPDANVVGEMLTFVIAKTGKAEASSGANDDLVLASAFGYWRCARPRSVHQKIVTAH